MSFAARALPSLVGALIALLCFAGCATTGDLRGSVPDIPPGTRVPTDAEERGLWSAYDDIEKELQTSPWLAREDGITAYLRELTCNLERAYCGDFRPYVLDRPGFSVYMAPNGMLLISTGSLLRFEREGHLAYVLGREIARYKRRHDLQILRRWRERFDRTAALGLVPWYENGRVRRALHGLAPFLEELEGERTGLATEAVSAAGYDTEAIQGWTEQMRAEAAASTSSKSKGEAGRENQAGSGAEGVAASSPAASFAKPAAWERYRSLVRPLRGRLLAAELERRDLDATEVLLKRLLERGEDEIGELYYYQGELFRLRARPGDLDRAVAAFQKSLELPGAPPGVHRSLGLALLARGDRDGAREALLSYLKVAPEAQDRELIRSQLSKVEGGEL